MENKQTAVDWLYEKLFHCEINIFEWQHYLEQAKAMHKEEIVKAVHFGINQWGGWDSLNGEQYYNEIYGGNNDQEK